MKKSNIIIIAFAAFVVISTLIFYIDGKKNEGKSKFSNADYKTIQLTEFSVVVAGQNADIHILQSDSNKLRVAFSKESPLGKSLYKIANDTLHLYQGNTLYAYGNNIRSIIAQKRANISIEKITSDTLKINLTGSYLYLNYHGKEKYLLKQVELQAQDSAEVNISGNISIEKFVCYSNNSTIGLFQGKFRSIEADLKNNSQLQFLSSSEGTNNLQIKKDSTCNINMN
ncbi:MAG: hypothetical protein QM751_12210 [Paludibacteraceae bacterium]